ncbi:MAG: HypC/HybG/HupF family hydrogenase formation chaperone [Sulfurimonas sp.]|nr:MAG: HypC/HybG/HupF family hydrogenase formation chaperone [Sulfurimonas sp.]PHS59506.1 MAG: HypC/HybG/HupF family hydrogenase formation chaperone [Sulfurimonas sp.]
MCLSIPSKVVKLDLERNVAIVDTIGVKREASLELMEEGIEKIGDYVLLHIGFIMNNIDEDVALETLKLYDEILEKLAEEDRRLMVIDDDNCEKRGA